MVRAAEPLNVVPEASPEPPLFMVRALDKVPTALVFKLPAESNVPSVVQVSLTASVTLAICLDVDPLELA